MNLQERNCLVCGKPFKARKRAIKIGGGKYCSQKCSHDAIRTRTKSTCLYCGNEFEEYPSRIKAGIGKYCSRQCASLGRRAVEKGDLSNLYRDKTWLENEYLIKQKSISTIAHEIGVSDWTIHHWLVYHGFSIEKRTSKWTDARRAAQSKRLSERSPSKQLDVRQKISQSHSGKNNPAWQGGISFEPYCPKFNKNLKAEIRAKYNYTCQRCEVKENGRRLSVHHINFDKMAGCYGKKWNLIPVCTKCHGWTGTHRFEAFNLFMNHWAMNPDITLFTPI